MSDKLEQVLAAIDDVNRADPNTELFQGNQMGKALIYGKRMSACLDHYWPDADPLLQIAVRAQHIKRWHIPRASYPAGRSGYLQWRKALGQFHAETTAEIMRENGFSEPECQQAATMIRKEKLKTDTDSQTLENVACLVFLQHYFEDFAAKHPEDKMILILQKTWRKMSTQAHEYALTLYYQPHLLALIQKALA